MDKKTFEWNHFVQHLVFETLSPFGDINLFNFHKDKLTLYARNIKNPFWRDVIVSYTYICKQHIEYLEEFMDLPFLNFIPYKDIGLFISW